MAAATTPHDDRPSDRSLWTQRSVTPAQPTLDHDLAVDVAVVGGGIVGATTTMLLAAEGCDVALLEGWRIGSGATGHSTAKATVHQGTEFSQLIDRLGTAEARLVIDGDRAGLDVIQKWTTELGIAECATPVTNWAWTSTEDGVRQLEQQAAAAGQLGVATRWAAEGELAFGSAALGVDGQLLIEPTRLCEAFSGRAAFHGARVFEHTRVRAVDDTDSAVVLTTADGCVVRARRVVLATHVPIVDRTLVFAACDYRRSHVIALDVPDAYELAPDMYTGIDPDGLSLRPARDLDGRPLLVVAGHGHSLHTDETGDHVDQLEQHARELIGPGAGELRHGWLTHDAFPSDGRPFVGPARGDGRIMVATGFGGWGLARGVSAALALSGQIIRGHARWEHPFDARRLGGFVRPKSIKAGAVTAAAAIGDRLTAKQAGGIDALEPGTGKVVRDGTHFVAAARDQHGTLHTVDAACTHLGCLVRHDPERQCWQCPCHGSRFDLDGAVLDGPATDPLERVDAPSA